MSTALYYQNPARAIDWLCGAFGFQVRLKVEGDGGRIEHSELEFGEAVVMVGHAGGREKLPRMPPGASPETVGGANTQNVMLYVDDVEEHYRQALAAGARIVDEPKVHDYGAEYWADRSYGALDLEGHAWWFTQRLRDPQ